MSDRRTDELERLIESGELSVMTECAYGRAIAESETGNALAKKKKKDSEEESK